MKNRILTGLTAFALCSSAWTFAADGDKPVADKPAPEKTAPAPQGGGGQRGGPGGGRFGGFGGAGGAFGRDPLAELVSVLGDLNLSSDFTLTAEQKEKIQAIRDEQKKQQEKWRADHEAELKKIQEQFAELRQAGQGQGAGGGGNREKFQEIMKSRQTLQETAPKSDEAVTQIRGLLATEQLKKFEAKLADNERARKEMRDRVGGGGNPGARQDAPAGGGRRGNRGGDNRPPANGV